MVSAMTEFQNEGVASDLAKNRSLEQTDCRGLKSEGEMRTEDNKRMPLFQNILLCTETRWVSN